VRHGVYTGVVAHSMNKLIILLISIISFSCGNQSENGAIQTFESILGKEKSDGLTQVVDHFESEILDKYETISLEEAYKKYLTNIVESNFVTVEEWLPVQYKRDSIFDLCKCGLVDEVWMKPDTIWVKNDRLYISYFSNPEDIEFGRKIRTTNIDSLISREKNTSIANLRGLVHKAFGAISETNELTYWYYDTRNMAGDFSRQITANLMLKNNIDYNDYFVKRIIVIETYY